MAGWLRFPMGWRHSCAPLLWPENEWMGQRVRERNRGERCSVQQGWGSVQTPSPPLSRTRSATLPLRCALLSSALLGPALSHFGKGKKKSGCFLSPSLTTWRGLDRLGRGLLCCEAAEDTHYAARIWEMACLQRKVRCESSPFQSSLSFWILSSFFFQSSVQASIIFVLCSLTLCRSFILTFALFSRLWVHFSPVRFSQYLFVIPCLILFKGV